MDRKAVERVLKRSQIRISKRSGALQHEYSSLMNTSIARIVLTITMVFVCSYSIYQTCNVRLRHGRNFIRSLNYQILQHDDLDDYWFGQLAINYPIHQYYKLTQFQDFFYRFMKFLQHMDKQIYGFNQQQIFNKTQQHFSIHFRNHTSKLYNFKLQKGIQQPFNVNNLQSIKKVLSNTNIIQINLSPFYIDYHKWKLNFSIQPFSQASIFVQIFAQEEINLALIHVPNFILGFFSLILLIKSDYFSMYRKRKFGEYTFSSLLIFNGFLSFILIVKFELILLVNGITCLLGWLLLLKYVTRDDDFRIALLLQKSYKLVGRLFLYLGPVFIGLGMFALCCFGRYALQYSSFHRTFMSLFYLSYYNMTYQSFIKTQRANPISTIFFIIFIILFTMCVYSGMLVSVFCSYVWHKRQEQVRQDVMSDIKIQCGNCNHKYRPIDCQPLIKANHRQSVSQYLQIDFESAFQKSSYKEILIKKLTLQRKLIEQIIINNIKIKQNYQRQQNSEIFSNLYQQQCKLLYIKILEELG